MAFTYSTPQNGTAAPAPPQTPSDWTYMPTTPRPSPASPATVMPDITQPSPPTEASRIPGLLGDVAVGSVMTPFDIAYASPAIATNIAGGISSAVGGPQFHAPVGTLPSTRIEQGLGLPQPEGWEIPAVGLATGAGAGGAASWLGRGVRAAESLPYIGPTAKAIGDFLAGGGPVKSAAIGAPAGAASGVIAQQGGDPTQQFLGGLGAGALTGLALGGTTGLANIAARDKLGWYTKAVTPVAEGGYGIRASPVMVDPLTGLIDTATAKITGHSVESPITRGDYNAAGGREFDAVPKDGKLSTSVMADAADSVGKPFNNLAAKATVPIDAVNADLDQVIADSRGVGAGAQPVLDFISNLRQVAAQNGGVIPGKWLQKELTAKGETAQGAFGQDVQNRELWSNTREALINGLSDPHSGLTPSDIADWQAAKTKWSAMITVNKALNLDGDIDPLKLSSAVQRSRDPNIRADGSPLNDLAQIGSKVIGRPATGGGGTLPWMLRLTGAAGAVHELGPKALLPVAGGVGLQYAGRAMPSEGVPPSLLPFAARVGLGTPIQQPATVGTGAEPPVGFSAMTPWWRRQMLGKVLAQEPPPVYGGQ